VQHLRLRAGAGVQPPSTCVLQGFLENTQRFFDVRLRLSDRLLEGNLIVSNISNYHAGGLLLVHSDATLVNNVIADNRGSARVGWKSGGRLLACCRPR